jgi:hypothetical protein
MAVLGGNAGLHPGSVGVVHAEVDEGRVRTLVVVCQVVPAQEFMATSKIV